MKGARKPSRTPPRALGDGEPLLVRFCWWTIVTAVALVPLAVDPKAFESFRLPKEAAFVAVACLLAIAMALLVLSGRWRQAWAPRQIWIYGVIAGWTAFAAIVAVDPAQARRGLTLVIAALLILGMCETLARRRDSRILLILLIPALLNSAYLVLQNFSIWDPLIDQEAVRQAVAASGRDYDQERRLGNTALAGGPIDAASSLIPAALVATALAMHGHRLRFLLVCAGVGITGVLIMTQVITAIGAAAAGIVTMVTLRWPRRTLIAIPAVLVVFAAAALTYPPLQTRLGVMRQVLATGDLDTVFTGRLPAFATAVEMARQRPWTGVGPAGFENRYSRFKLRAEEKYPSLLDSSARNINFASSHNDFLDVLAETGIPGLILMLVALGLLARDSFTRSSGAVRGDRQEAGRLLAAPLAVAFGVLALAQFPLSLYGTLIQFLFAAGAARAWTADGA